MPTGHTKTTIANRALDFISEFPISDIDTDASPYSRWMRRNYMPVVQAALRLQPWNFACEFFYLDEAADAPSFRWKRKFFLPPGWLRVIPPTVNGERGGRLIPYEVKGNYFYASRYGDMPVEIVMDKQNPGEWDPLFSEYVAALLALGCAHRFTAKNTFVQTCRELAQQALDSAAEINAFEGSLEPIQQHDIIDVRYRGGSDWY